MRKVYRSVLPAVFVAILFLSSVAQVESSLSPDLRQKIDHAANDVLTATGVPECIDRDREGWPDYLSASLR